MILSDFHTHSTFSTDGTDELAEMARSAVEKGLKTICFTEHNDFDYPDGEFLLDFDGKMRYSDGQRLEAYRFLVPLLQKTFPKAHVYLCMEDPHIVRAL